MRKLAEFWKKGKDRSGQCSLCAHRCNISNGSYSVCLVRYNDNGVLITTTYGKPVAVHVDPIEKKPLYHFLPGTNTFSVATAGCNFKCGFCQNWNISQDVSLMDQVVYFSAEKIAEKVFVSQCESVSYTYTEPTIFFEYAYDIARIVSEKGIKNIFVTNGYMTQEALDYIRKYLDAANIDLKAFSENFYHKHCKASLAPVLETIKRMKDNGIWIELTTLLIPGENDSDEELKKLTKFIASVDKAMPWHISRFSPSYNMMDKESTSLEVLEKAKKIGEKAGLKYVYVGNIEYDNNTYCPKCKAVLIKRKGFSSQNIGVKNNKCIKCNSEIDGVYK
ncbi:MAG: AmmeMemoRadiSam system radical SAM enzyme [Candidatus Omnitrophica bacterium]|nr:AmmeMemoRadiSam system radical SAM enzyme [Candidatus Omnitrophota bacterium]